jgi:hypothetical protein
VRGNDAAARQLCAMARAVGSWKKYVERLGFKVRVSISDRGSSLLQKKKKQ